MDSNTVATDVPEDWYMLTFDGADYMSNMAKFVNALRANFGVNRPEVRVGTNTINVRKAFYDTFPSELGPLKYGYTVRAV